MHPEVPSRTKPDVENRRRDVKRINERTFGTVLPGITLYANTTGIALARLDTGLATAT